MPLNAALLSNSNSKFPWAQIFYGAIFLAAIIVLALTLSDRISSDNDLLTLSIRDESGRPVENALVAYGDAVYRSDADGEVFLSVLNDPEAITVEHEDYTTVIGEFASNQSRNQTLTLQPASDGPEPQHVAQSAAAATAPATIAVESTTAAPTEARETTSATQSPTSRATANGEVAGTVVNIDGEPIAEGWVTDGSVFAFTDADGNFVFEPGVIQPDATLTVFGSGYHEQAVPVPANGEPMQITLEHQMIRGIYYNPNISNTQEDIDELIRIANTTEVNAIVIDIKEELVFYDTSVPLFNEAGVVTPILDLPNLLKQFQDNGIYTIARLVVFKDSAVAEAFPELAVIDNQTGDLWRDMNGIAWVNPMDHTLWDANIDLAYEAATMGFDEIQYDYIRFPTDGDLSRVSYGLENSQENREAAIEKFLQRSHETLIPTGVKLSADIFGYTVMVEDDLGIGQNIDHLVNYVDYLSPMVYPSHWPEGSMALDGHPNDYPYEAIEISMGLAVQQLDGNRLKLRPWLQDFNHWVEGSREYGEAEVRAQIDAVNDLGLSGWLIWDPNNWYHEGAFAPESDEAPVATPSTPAVATPAATTKTTRSARKRWHRPWPAYIR